MAKEIKSSTTATGKDMNELLDNVYRARRSGWIVLGPIVKSRHNLRQTLVKLGHLDHH